MPVPESGPALPFPYAADETAGAAPAPSSPTISDGNEDDLDDEKSFVGDFLTRVFGSGTQQSDAAGADSDQREGAKGKAAKLARETVADFASEKLGAPSVASALHADKPFMDQIADSLELALAQTDHDRHDEDDFDDEVAAASAADEDLPDLPFPPDPEFLPFGVSSEAPQAATPSAKPEPEPAETSADHGLDQPKPASDRTDRAFPRHADAMFEDPSAAYAALDAELSPPRREMKQAEPAPAAQQPAVPPQFQAPAAELPPHDPAQVVASPGADFSFPAGLEDSIKEMIKPLIVQWLNDNLPRIVEKAVREELSDTTGKSR